MPEYETFVTWQEIAVNLPTKPSVRTLQRKWKVLRLPIRTDKITGKKYISKNDLIVWLTKNPNKI